MRAAFRRNSSIPSTEPNPFNRPLASDKSVECDILSHSLNLFMSNEFTSCLRACSDKETSSIYHAFAKAVLCFINAGTVQHKHEVSSAIRALQSCLQLCHSGRRKSSLFSSRITHVLNRGTVDVDIYSDYEVHAELLSAECRLMLVLLQMIAKEQTASQFMRQTSNNIIYCVSSLKICLTVIEKRTNWESESSLPNFKSGLYLSIGIMNIMLAIMPLKIERELASDGFYGDRGLGITFLEQAVALDGVQQMLAILACLVAGSMFPESNTLSAVLIDSSNQDMNNKYPEVAQVIEIFASSSLTANTTIQSAFLSYLTGCLMIRKKNHQKAKHVLHQSIDSQSSWSELHTACMIELMWCHACLLEWDEAIDYAKTLASTIFFLPHLYNYLTAGFMQAKEASERIASGEQPYFQLTEDSRFQVEACMKRVKALSCVSFDQLSGLQTSMQEAADSYLDHAKDLLLPFLEIAYMLDRLPNMPTENLNQMSILAKERLDKVLSDEVCLMADFDAPYGAPLDSYSVILLLQAACRMQGCKGKCDDSALSYASGKLKQVIEKKHRIKDLDLVSQAMMELGILLCDNKQAMEGRFWLESLEQEFAHSLTLDKLMKIDSYLRQAVPDANDNFEQPRKMSLTGRRTSAVEIQAKMLRQLARRRSGSIGSDHASDFPIITPPA